MKRLTIVAGAMALLGAWPACAQDVFSWPAPKQAAGPGRMFYLPMGTPLALVTRTQISSRENKPGDRIYFTVAESVTFRGQIIIPIGAPVVGEVISVQRNGHFGRRGKIAVRLLYAQTPHGPVRLTGRASDDGKSGTLASVATMTFVSGLGFLIRGTSAYIEPDTPVQAYLAEPLDFYWYPQREDAAVLPAQPDTSRHLPDRFDPSVFGGRGPGFSQ